MVREKNSLKNISAKKYSDILAEERTLLAEQRTLLAKIRTAIGIAALGFALIRFFQDEKYAFLVNVGWFLIVGSILLFLWGEIQYFQHKNYLQLFKIKKEVNFGKFKIK